MVLARFVLLAAVLLAASTVSAAVTIDLGPSDYRNFGSGSASHAGGGVRSSFGQTVRIPPANTSLNVSRNALIPYGSIANGAKNFVRINPGSAAASAALTALFLGLDWAFNPEHDQWMKQGESSTEYVEPLSGGFIASDGGFGQLFPTASAACAVTGGCVNYGACTPGPLVGATYGHCRTSAGSPYGTYTIQGPSCPAGSYFDNHGCAVTIDGEWEDLTESDWSEFQNSLPSSPADQVADAASDIQRRQGGPLPGYQDQTITGPSSVSGPETTSTSTDPVTGDTIVTNTQTTTNISYGDTTITTSNTTVTNTYTNGNLTNTETTTETPGELPVTDPSSGGTAGEWPGFCDWASVVCNFIDWFQEPFDAPEVEWPLIEDQDYQEEFDFTLAASCPEPYTIELALFPPVQFNWQPFCDLATFIKPLVLASAAIFAAFISLGIARART